jgi:hypothetical protein
VQSELAGAEVSDSVALYSYLSGESPDTSLLYVPACTAATRIIADVDDSEVTPPSVAVYFVIDASLTMGDCVDGSDTCTQSAGDRRIDYVVEAMDEGIQALFDAYADKPDATMEIGVLTYSGPYYEGQDVGTGNDDGTEPIDVCNDVGDEETDCDDIDDLYTFAPGYYIHSSLVDRDSETSIREAVEEIATDTTNLKWWTPGYLGLEEAVQRVETSGADVKVVVTLSDGAWTHFEDWYHYDDLSLGIDDIFFEARDEIVLANSHSDILFFSASIATGSTYKAYINHLSSDECGVDSTDIVTYDSDSYAEGSHPNVTSSGWSSTTDCQPRDGVEYAFEATTAEEIEAMFEEIINTILGTVFTFTTDEGTTDGAVLYGNEMELPFPEGFACTEEEFTLPMRVSFQGSGAVTIENILITSCPAD